MAIFTADSGRVQPFFDTVGEITADLARIARPEELDELKRLSDDFKAQIDDFYSENRKLNLGIVGQVKAGKSSFLNALLFEGKDVLPKASTPKTATLTKIEYSPENKIYIEYYSTDEWEQLERNAKIDSDEQVFASARELVEMLRQRRLDPTAYLERGKDEFTFGSYDELLSRLNDYVGEDGKFTPIVKAVTLYLGLDALKELSIVDTPGMNDPISSRTAKTKEFMSKCDVVFFLSQAGSFLDESDWTLLSNQLPQEGVNRLTLIASKYDSGIRDVLRVREAVKDDLDLDDDDENTTDSIPKACKIIQKKLTRRAKSMVKNFAADLEERGRTQLIDVVQGIAKPLMVSAMVYNMTRKSMTDFSPEEMNVYSALKPFSKDMAADLKMLGDFGKVQEVFDEVVAAKQKILDERERELLPNAVLRCRTALEKFMDRANTLARTLKTHDRKDLEAQRKAVEGQINSIKVDITSLFGEWSTRLESEKADAVRALRDASQKYATLKERTGSRQETHTVTVPHSYRVSDSKWYNPFSWGKSHRETYYTTETETRTVHYQYCLASDVSENLSKYAVQSAGQVEKIFTDTIQLREMRRKLLNLILNNFDLGSEKYDSNLFKLMVEETVATVEFPVFTIDVSQDINAITSQFTGEITGSNLGNLSAALTNALSRITDSVCTRTADTVRSFRENLMQISRKVQDSLLENIKRDFDDLIKKCADKEREIAGYESYIEALKKAIKKLESI